MDKPPFYRLILFTASGVAMSLAGWLASVPGQEELKTTRLPITCTDAAGILYERGTPGFERCLKDMLLRAEAKTPSPAPEQAGAVEIKPKYPHS